MKRKSPGYWTKERIKIHALECKTITELQKKYYRAYHLMRINNWYDEVCSHMETSINGNFIIYAYEFSDNYVYVGLTRNRKERLCNHKTKISSPVYKHSKLINEKPICKILWGDEDKVYYADLAKEKEEYYLQQYLNNGWFKLKKLKLVV